MIFLDRFLLNHLVRQCICLVQCLITLVLPTVAFGSQAERLLSKLYKIFPWVTWPRMPSSVMLMWWMTQPLVMNTWRKIGISDVNVTSALTPSKIKRNLTVKWKYKVRSFTVKLQEAYCENQLFAVNLLVPL